MSTRTLSFISGLTIGAGVMLLYAPKTGAQTRAAIAKGAANTQRYVRKQTDHARKTFHDAMKKGRKAYKATAHGVADAWEEGRRVFA